MSDYLVWVCESIIKDRMKGIDPELAWNLATEYATTHDLSNTKYSIENYLKDTAIKREVKKDEFEIIL